jgi:hypothetical protein
VTLSSAISSQRCNRTVGLSIGSLLELVAEKAMMARAGQEPADHLHPVTKVVL